LVGNASLRSKRAESPNYQSKGTSRVADVGRIVGIALKLGLEGLFLEDCPHGDQHAEQGDS